MKLLCLPHSLTPEPQSCFYELLGAGIRRTNYISKIIPLTVRSTLFTTIIKAGLIKPITVPVYKSMTEINEHKYAKHFLPPQKVC
jgi:hypothetical protein